jgi:hypothetical protein
MMNGIPRLAFKNMHTQACGKYVIISSSKARACFRETRPVPEASANTISTRHLSQTHFSPCARGMTVLQEPWIGQVYYKKKSRQLTHWLITVLIQISKLFLCSERDNNFSVRYSRACPVSRIRSLQSLSDLSMSGCRVVRRVVDVIWQYKRTAKLNCAPGFMGYALERFVIIPFEDLFRARGHFRFRSLQTHPLAH